MNSIRVLLVSNILDDLRGQNAPCVCLSLFRTADARSGHSRSNGKREIERHEFVSIEFRSNKEINLIGSAFDGFVSLNLSFLDKDVEKLE